MIAKKTDPNPAEEQKTKTFRFFGTAYAANTAMMANQRTKTCRKPTILNRITANNGNEVEKPTKPSPKKNQ